MTPKRVVLLGAGASADSKFHRPTMDCFFGDGILNEPEFLPLLEFLKAYSPSRDATSVNLEDVMSYLEVCEGEFGHLGPRYRQRGEELEMLAQLLRRYVLKRLDHRGEDSGVKEETACAKHVRLFEGLGRGNTVINLN